MSREWSNGQVRITEWDESYPCRCVRSATVDTPIRDWPLAFSRHGDLRCDTCQDTCINPIPYGELRGIREQDLYWYDGEGIKRL